MIGGTEGRAFGVEVATRSTCIVAGTRRTVEASATLLGARCRRAAMVETGRAATIVTLATEGRTRAAVIACAGARADVRGVQTRHRAT